MRLYIASVMEGKGADDYYVLMRSLIQRYDLHGFAEKLRIPHITCKAPFDCDEITVGDVEEALETVRRKTPRISRVKSTLSSLNGNVLCLTLEREPTLVEMHRETLFQLRKVPGLTWSEYDTPDKVLHVTLVKEGELEGRLEVMMQDLQGTQVDFSITNLAIMEKVGKGTTVRKMYLL